MKEQDLNIIKKLSQRLKRSLNIIEVILFGSRARGTNETDSDFDVCIIVEDLNTTIRDLIFTIAWEISLEEGVVITPLIFKREEVQDSPITESPIYNTILREGIRVE